MPLITLNNKILKIDGKMAIKENWPDPDPESLIIVNKSPNGFWFVYRNQFNRIFSQQTKIYSTINVGETISLIIEDIGSKPILYKLVGNDLIPIFYFVDASTASYDFIATEENTRNIIYVIK